MKKVSVLREEKGFTLIELAIVLVIIGIILGAVLKGQDLIAGARAKKFINDAGKKWEVATWTHFDRKGRFPGDLDINGVIGDGNAQSDLAALNLSNPPTHNVVLGSSSFYVFLGSDDATAAANQQNLIIICKTDDCLTPFTADDMAFLETFDTSIDGTSNGALGLVRGVNAEPDNITAADYVATYDGDQTGAAWAAGTTQALIYFFDKKSN